MWLSIRWTGAECRPPRCLIYHHLLSRRLSVKTNREQPSSSFSFAHPLSCPFLSFVIFIYFYLSRTLPPSVIQYLAVHLVFYPSYQCIFITNTSVTSALSRGPSSLVGPFENDVHGHFWHNEALLKLNRRAFWWTANIGFVSSHSLVVFPTLRSSLPVSLQKTQHMAYFLGILFSPQPMRPPLEANRRCEAGLNDLNQDGVRWPHPIVRGDCPQGFDSLHSIKIKRSHYMHFSVLNSFLVFDFAACRLIISITFPCFLWDILVRYFSSRL